jgi:hypothetical protein
MATQTTLKLDGMTAEEVFDKLVTTGVSHSDAAIIASGWIFENFGRTKRTFHYVEPFAAVEPTCASQFSRTLQHQDWVDGEDVVQAEQTVGEEGFNARFHKIENDLDALGADVAKAFACLAAMRRSLRALLDELKAELNRLNNDVYQCCRRPTGPGPIIDFLPNFGGLASEFLGMSTFDGKNVTLWNTPQGMVMLPALSGIGVEITADIRVKRVSALARLFEEDRTIQQHFANRPVTKDELVSRFGNELARDGRSVRELVTILPDTGTFENLGQLVDAVGEREAAALRTTRGAQSAVAAVFGLGTEVETVGKASIDRFESIPGKARAALLSRNVSTMSEFAKLSAAQVAKVLQQEGVEASPGEAAEWVAEARTLMKVR